MATELYRGLLEVVWLLEATAAEGESRGCSWDLGGARSTVEGELWTSGTQSTQIELAGEEDLVAAMSWRTREQNLDLRGWEAREGQN